MIIASMGRSWSLRTALKGMMTYTVLRGTLYVPVRRGMNLDFVPMLLLYKVARIHNSGGNPMYL